jgi:hypothetical protein
MDESTSRPLADKKKPEHAFDKSHEKSTDEIEQKPDPKRPRERDGLKTAKMLVR